MPEYTLIPQVNRGQIMQLNTVVKTCQREMALAEQEGDDMVRALIAGAAMQQLRGLLTDQVMGDIMPLVGSPLGISIEFGKNWPLPVVRDVVLAGLLAGARVVGAEIHIASGRLYLTKAYWERRFREYAGVSSVMPPTLGLPRYQQLGDKNYATVQAKLTYRLNGQLQTLDRTGDNAITVLVNSGMGLDAIHGKAKKRLYQTAYAVVSGQHVEDDEDAITAGTAEFRAGEPVGDPTVVDGEFTVTPEGEGPAGPESAGDEIAAAASGAVADQTPAGPSDEVSEAKKMALATMRLKTGAKAVAAWVGHCAGMAPPVDIAAEADAYIRELAARK
jgi:hypothetical protein